MSAAESQKRTDDLRVAVKTENIAAIPGSGNTFLISLPDDYRYLVKIRLNITYDCNGVETADTVTPKQVEQDDIHVLLETFSRSRYGRKFWGSYSYPQ